MLGNPSPRHEAVPLTLDQFAYAFSNVCTKEETQAAYERYHIAAPGRIVGQGVLDNVGSHPATEVDFAKPDRTPLLFIAGSEDRVTPPAVNRSNYRHYLDRSTAIVAYRAFPGRSHLIPPQTG